MRAPFTLDDRARLLRWLSQGAAVVNERKGERARPGDVIWWLLQNAVQTMDAAPDRESRFLNPNMRVGCWSSVGLSFREAIELEKVRMHAAMEPHSSRAPVTLAHEQDRALDVLGFLRWCGIHVRSSRADDMRRAAVFLAREGDGSGFRAAWLKGTRPDMTRQAVSKFRQVLCGHILAGLREDCKIYPVPGTCEFI